MSIFGRKPDASSGRRILIAFGGDLDEVVLAAALRIARAEHATIVPAYLIEVPLSCALDSPMHEQVERAMPVIERVEQEARSAGVAVDSRMERGRTLRDALARLWHVEHFDRVILPATGGGFTPADLAWALTVAPTETLVLRSAPREGP